MVPKSCGTSSREGEFGLPIYLFVGILALLLSIALNAALTTQPFNIFPHEPSLYPSLIPPLSLFLFFYLKPLCFCPPPPPKKQKNPFYFSSLPFYSLPLVGTQMITSQSLPTWPPLLPKIPHKLVHSEDSLETCNRHQTTFESGFA